MEGFVEISHQKETIVFVGYRVLTILYFPNNRTNGRFI